MDPATPVGAPRHPGSHERGPRLFSSRTGVRTPAASPGTTAGGRPVPRSVRIRPGTQGGNGEPPTLPHGTSSTCGASPPLHSGRVAAVPHGVDKTRRTPPTSYPELRWPLRSPRERPQSVPTTPGRQGRLCGHRSPEAGQHP